MIIRGGVNIYPAEIEQTLVAHPAVAEAAVVGWPSQERGEEVAAFVVCRADVTEQDLIAHCRGVARALQDPREGYSSSTQLPKSGLGKVLKPALVRAAAAVGVSGPAHLRILLQAPAFRPAAS